MALLDNWDRDVFLSIFLWSPAKLKKAPLFFLLRRPTLQKILFSWCEELCVCTLLERTDGGCTPRSRKRLKKFHLVWLNANAVAWISLGEINLVFELLTDPHFWQISPRAPTEKNIIFLLMNHTKGTLNSIYYIIRKIGACQSSMLGNIFKVKKDTHMLLA